ncbi:MAG: hypothetical protein ACO1TE_29250 [Prosthecobacter sp.]
MKPSTFYREYLHLRTLLWRARDFQRQASDHARNGQQAQCTRAWEACITVLKGITECRARLHLALTHATP